MSDRERKRAELRKRKARTRAMPAEATVGRRSNGEVPMRPEPPPMSRSQARDEEAREALVPLAEGERPLVVTIGAVISIAIGVSVLAAYAAGATVEGHRPHIAQVIAPALLMGTMAWGMWRARYWAVLGFQVVLLFIMLGSAAGLVKAVDVVEAAGRGLILAGSGALFFFMIRAMARIQMPERRPRD